MNEFEELKNKKEKEDKKKGFIGWLKEKLGFSPKGMGTVSEGARGINLANIGKAGSFVGRGAGLKGAGFLSFFGGKAGLLTMGLVALAVGTTLYYRSMDNTPISSDGKAYIGDTSYVPRILREQQSGSSLDIFREANRGIIKEEDDTEAKYKNQKEEMPQETPQIDANLGFDNKESMDIGRKKLQTDMQFGLSTGFGSGTNNKFSGLGGFGNHMGKFGPSVGSGFSKNELGNANDLLRKATGGKLSAMNSQKRPVIAKANTLKGMKGGRTALDQAKAIKGMALQPNYGSADTARYTLDKAWEGTTGSGGVGLPSGGSGVSSGGEGVVQTPSTLDNIGDTMGSVPNTQVPNVPGYKFDTPWASLLQKAMMFLMISALLAGIASMVAKIKPWGLIVAVALAMAAVAMAVMVIMIGIQIQKVFGQNKLGMLYIIGGGLAIAAAIAAIAGAWESCASWAVLLAKILAAGAGIMAMFAAMAAGPAAQDYAKKQIEEQTKQEQKTSMNLPYRNLLS